MIVQISSTSIHTLHAYIQIQKGTCSTTMIHFVLWLWTLLTFLAIIFSKAMSNLIPDSPPRNPARKKGKREYEGSGIEYPKCVICKMEFRKNNCIYCKDDECHFDMYHDWVTYKYRDDPSMLHVFKGAMEVCIA